MCGDPQANRAQADHWAAAQRWIDFQSELDTVLAPVLDRLLAEADLRPGQAVLDIGCGTGASTIAAAGAVGPEGRALGADISPLLLGRARQRLAAAELAHVRMVDADAQTHAFAAAGFDRVISRFGVMFFADPPTAFSNIARALKPGGRLVFMAWAPLEVNPWFAIPREAAMRRMGALPPLVPRAPGPFGLQERDYVAGALHMAGLQDVSATEIGLDLTPPGTARAAAAVACRVGIAARVLGELGGTPADAQAIEDEVAEGFARFETDAGTRVPARLNLCLARRADPGGSTPSDRSIGILLDGSNYHDI